VLRSKKEAVELPEDSGWWAFAYAGLLVGVALGFGYALARNIAVGELSSSDVLIAAAIGAVPLAAGFALVEVGRRKFEARRSKD